MVKRRSYGCGLEAALAVIGGKWKFLVVYRLAVNGPQRFGQLRRLVDGVSEKMLISTLRELQADGIVVRTDFREVPPRVQYSLTEFGFELSRAVEPLCEWGTTHMLRISKLPSQTVDA